MADDKDAAPAPGAARETASAARTQTPTEPPQALVAPQAQPGQLGAVVMLRDTARPGGGEPLRAGAVVRASPAQRKRWTDGKAARDAEPRDLELAEPFVITLEPEA